MPRKQPHHAAPAHFCISIPALRWNFVVAIDRSIYYGRFRLCGAYRAATCAGDTDAPAWQTEKGELRQPTILARFGYPENLDDLASHAVVHYSLTPGVSSPGFAFETPHGMQWVKPAEC